MNQYLLLAILGLTVGISLGLYFWQYRICQKLKQDLNLLAEQVRRNNADVAGLCSAAVIIDQHLLNNDRQLQHLREQVSELANQQLSQPVGNLPNSQISVASPVVATAKESVGYESVIEKIRQGMGVEELVKECGLTRDEAVLLNRLHGGR